MYGCTAIQVLVLQLSDSRSQEGDRIRLLSIVMYLMLPLTDTLLELHLCLSCLHAAVDVRLLYYAVVQYLYGIVKLAHLFA
eukprot:6461528-Amphidinium_carterae.4